MYISILKGPISKVEIIYCFSRGLDSDRVKTININFQFNSFYLITAIHIFNAHIFQLRN